MAQPGPKAPVARVLVFVVRVVMQPPASRLAVIAEQNDSIIPRRRELDRPKPGVVRAASYPMMINPVLPDVVRTAPPLSININLVVVPGPPRTVPRVDHRAEANLLPSAVYRDGRQAGKTNGLYVLGGKRWAARNTNPGQLPTRPPESGMDSAVRLPQASGGRPLGCRMQSLGRAGRLV